MQHRAAWWPNECSMLDSTMLDDITSTCCIRLARPNTETEHIYFKTVQALSIGYKIR